MTVLTVDLLPGTHAYCDLHRDAPPILVIDTGPTEVQLSLSTDRVTLQDLNVFDALLEAATVARHALLAYLE